MLDLVEARKKARKSSFAHQVASFAENELATHVLEQDKDARFSDHTLSALRTSGLLSIELGSFTSSDLGSQICGLGHGKFLDVVTAIRVLSRVDASVGVLVHVHNALVCRLITRFGSDGQKEKWLPKLANELVGAFAATEIQAGSDLASMQTRAEKTVNGYRLIGAKHWITNASEAGLFIVFAAMPDGGSGAFLLEREAEGLIVGPRLAKMSVRASSTCGLTLNNVDVSEDALLGNETMGMDIAQYGLAYGRIGISAQMLGIAEGALRLAVAYAQNRAAFGDKIINYQGVAFPLAQSSAEIMAVELMTRHGAEMVDSGAPLMKISDLANKAKLLGSQVAERACSASLEAFGGNGVSPEFLIEKYLRDAKVGKIYEGTVNILLRTIAHGMEA